MDWLNDTANANATGRGNFFRPGKGVLILKNVQVFKGHGDPYTYLAEFVVKESSSVPNELNAEPNAAGTTVSYPQKLTRASYPDIAKGNAKALNIAILGPEAESASGAELAGMFSKLLRVEQDGPMKGYTKKGDPCPARGFEIAYETIEKRVKTKTGAVVPMSFPTFTHVPPTAETVKKNRALLDNTPEIEPEG